MIYLALTIALGLFLAVLRAGGVVERSIDILVVARRAAAVVASTSLGEDEKERQIQQDAVSMMRAFAVLAFWSAGAVAASAGAIVSGSLLDLYHLDDAVAVADSWEVIVAAGVLSLFMLKVLRR